MMKISASMFFVVLLLFTGCGATKDGSIINEINNLETNESKQAYLEHILEVDQGQRQGQVAEIMLKYGKNSKESLDYAQKFVEQDLINLEKTERYLEKFGYPNIDSLGKSAAITPWVVIHHNNGLAVRERNYKILKKAFQDGNITDRQFILFLYRWHQIKFGKRLIIKSPYRIDDELQAYEKALNLNVY